MPSLSGTPDKIANFNKFGLHPIWPRFWIILLGIILIFLCFCIAGMEVGNILYDLYRGTAFGGFIVFIPLLICAIFIIITAFKPTLVLLRITAVLCCIMIILCLALIAYDILVIIDPTRCFILNCANANVNYVVNSTYNSTTSGWPLNITYPAYFQANMTAKVIFQAVQLFLAALFILFCVFYILTYIIYRRIKVHHHTGYNADHNAYRTNETNGSQHRHSVAKVYPDYQRHGLSTMYHIELDYAPQVEYHHSPLPVVVTTTTTTKRKTKKTTMMRPRAYSVNYDRMCTSCLKEPRMNLTTDYERHNFFSHLCVNCNNELLINRRKPPLGFESTTNRKWKP